MVCAVQAVGARVLEVGAKSDGVGSCAIGGKPDYQQVAGSRHRRSIDGG